MYSASPSRLRGRFLFCDRLPRRRGLFLFRLRATAIEADIDHIGIDVAARRRQRERNIGIDMREGDAVDRRGHRHRDVRQFGDDRFSGLRPSCTTARRNGTSTSPGPPGRAGDDASFDADLHGHDTGVDVAFARGAHDRCPGSAGRRPRVRPRPFCCRSSASQRRCALSRSDNRSRWRSLAAAASVAASPVPVVAFDEVLKRSSGDDLNRLLLAPQPASASATANSADAQACGCRA